MRYDEAYIYGRSALEQSMVPDAALDARLLLEWVCGTRLSDMYSNGERELSEYEENAYRRVIDERSKRIPLQYITGTADFMGLEFKVDGNVLIPRQDTEILVEEVLRYLHDGMEVLDLCTGSGCILLSILNYSNDVTGTGTDLHRGALQMAEANGELLGIRAKWLEGDLFDPVEERYDIIVSNPPYVVSDVVETLEPEVRLHEPVSALDGGSDGMDLYRRIIPESISHLKRGGMLFLEIGYDQGKAVMDMMEANGFSNVECVKDYAGLDRVVLGRLPL